MEVVAKYEFERYQHEQSEIIRQMQETIERLTVKLQWIEAKPCDLWTKEECRQHIIHNGKPIHRETMNSYIKQWLKDGKLQPGVNYQSAGNTCLISSDFIKGQQPAHKINLKVA